MFDEILDELDLTEELNKFSEGEKNKNWLEEWYAESPSGSVLADFESGNFDEIHTRGS
jgi:hypothetical protein